MKEWVDFATDGTTNFRIRGFAALAEALRVSRPVALSGLDNASDLVQWIRDREAIIVACYESNPRFDRERFTEWTER